MEASQADPKPVKIRQHSKDLPLTRPWLESLSTGELAKLADRFGIDIPVDTERIFIIEELLETASSGESISKNDLDTNPHFMETAALPKQYNISYIEVIIRDPLWAFVFWEIKEHDRGTHEKADDFEGYCLRVVPVNEEKEKCASDAAGESFTVVIDANDTARYLGFPEDKAMSENQGVSLHDRSYIIKLCAIRSGQEIPLAVSRTFTLPMLIEKDGLNNGGSKGISNLYQNPYACLSGARDFSVIKSTDRQLRAKRL